MYIIEKAVKIKSFNAGNLYTVNNQSKDGDKKYITGDAVINESIFSKYMKHHNFTVSKKNTSYDFIVMKFKYGVKKVMSANELREYYYTNGADVTWKTYNKEGNCIDDKTKKIHYKMLMRNPGKAKEGDCIFIKEDLYNVAIKYLTMGLYDKMDNEKAQIVEMSAYSTLSTATATGYISISLDNIFIVEDEKVLTYIKGRVVKTHEIEHKLSDENINCINYSSLEQSINDHGLTFYESKLNNHPEYKCINKSKKALCENGIESWVTKECYVDRSDEKVEDSVVLWDGMGLIDESIFPEDREGFIYCRNHFFKSCLFRGNIQNYFKSVYGGEYETAEVKDMTGTIKKISEIKVIVTNNSVKWTKFKELMGGDIPKAYKYYKKFMDKNGKEFEIVKSAHKSKWGNLQRGSYQINNSLPCSDTKTLERIAAPNINYCNQLKMNHETFMDFLAINASKRYNINNVLIALDKWNENFKYTKFFKDNKNDIISEFKKRLKLGKLLQEGDNLTICGNPIALLMKVTGQDFMKENCFEQINYGIQCYTTRFQDGERIAGFRNPHNAPNNIIHLINTYSEPIQKYFPKLGDNVIIINGIGTDVQSRLNSQDLDSDFIYATNQPDIAKLAEKAYCEYPTIINGIQPDTKYYKKNMESYAKMDSGIAANQYSIGEASNLAQLALSYYYHDGATNTELEDVFIICSVLAQIAIDSAKRSFDIDVNSELSRLKKLDCMKREDNKIYPHFYADIQNIKISKKNRYKQKKTPYIDGKNIDKFSCPMDILYDIIEKESLDMRKYKNLNPITCDLKMVFQFSASGIRRESRNYYKVIDIAKKFDNDISAYNSEKEDYSEKVLRKFDECLTNIQKQSLNRDTTYVLIAYAFSENCKIRNRLLTLLYDSNPQRFLNCFKNSLKVHTETVKTPILKDSDNLPMKEEYEKNVG